ncbi:MAG: Asp-tRNA(Asn)/Glu-tRNA(Gln) amidotransferase subunit GatC [Candidatus Colwellbacteria bacterium]|nr:Asp-tRNA(Asn)/Glu-tRNA(Gln) amidotransferase subunit GatC [Candidatus Colwellbacteria bacterium]
MELDIEYLAKLARIELTEAEKEKFSKELDEILDHFKELQELDTKDIKPMTGGTSLENVVREDDPSEWTETGKGRTSFPEEKDGFLMVPKMFE